MHDFTLKGLVWSFQTFSNPVPCPQLTQEEKECCCQENLCLYCRQPNHMAVNCLKKPSNTQTNHSLTKTTTTVSIPLLLMPLHCLLLWSQEKPLLRCRWPHI